MYILSLGASTPVGRDAWSSAAAARAAIAGFTEHPYIIDTTGSPMRVAMAPWLDVECQGQDRLEALLFPAIDQALDGTGDRLNDMRVALALALPSPRPGFSGDLANAITSAVGRRYSGRFAAQAMLAVGHAAAFLGLRAATRKMADGAFDLCVLAGVESYLEAETLEWLESNDQLHGAGALNNAWGFIPGEAAGAVLLARGDAAERLQMKPMGRVIGVGRGEEPNRIKTETVCVGEGLTAAFREGLAGLPPGAQVTDIYCDLNGEPYRADEFGFATLRTKEHFVRASEFVAPAEYWGDVSAAAAPLSLMLATVAARKAYARGRYAFLWASSETGERGSALVDFSAEES